MIDAKMEKVKKKEKGRKERWKVTNGEWKEEKSENGRRKWSKEEGKEK